MCMSDVVVVLLLTVAWGVASFSRPHVKRLYSSRHIGEPVVEVLWLFEGGVLDHHGARLLLVEERGVVHLSIVYCLHLSFSEPLDALAIFPQTKLNFVVLGDDVGAKAVLFALVPVALVAPLIGPCVDAKAVLLVILVLSLVHSAVIPNVDAHALHVIVEPLTLIPSAVEPRVHADARYLVLPPVARVHRSIVPLVATDAVLASKGVLTLILRLVSPGLNTVAMLKVILPHALILSTIHVLVRSHAVRLVIRPVPVIDVTVHVDKSALTVSSILTPLTGVLGLVSPHLLAKAIAEASLPLAAVDGTSAEYVRGPLLPWLIRIVKVLRDRLTSLLLREVLGATQLLRLEHADQAACRVTAPPCLNLDNKFHLVLQQFVIVYILDAKSTCAILSDPSASSLIAKALRLAIHVELGMLTVLAHTIAAIRLTVAHL